MKKIKTRTGSPSGVTLLELLVVVTILGLLATLGVASWKTMINRGKSTQCLQKMRNLGQALQLYAQDHAGELPRSFHSAGTHRQPGWAASIAPYLGVPEPIEPVDWPRIFEQHFRCPVDSSKDPSLYSYGLNVYFELDPEGDSYPGSPQTWRRFSALPHPARTILLAEIRPTAWADHFMSHLWTSTSAARQALAQPRHQGKNHFFFADGSVRPLSETEAFPTTPLSWNPWHPTGRR